METILLSKYKILVIGFLLIFSSTIVKSQNNAMSFTAANSQYVEVPNSTSLTLNGTYTLEAWVNYSGNNRTIVDKGSYNHTFQLHTNRISVYNVNTGWVTTNGLSIQNAWHHVVVTNSGTTQKHYVDGVLVGTYTVSALSTIPGVLRIGQQDPNGCVCNYFQGLMDELRIWNYARSAAQISTNMNVNLAPEAGLVAYYTFNQSSGALQDQSGNGNHGVLHNGPTYVASGVSISAPCTIVASSAVTGPLDCNGSANGQITGSATGGSTPYTYAWSNSATTASITGLVAGTYSVTITDANGCTDSESVAIGGAISLQTVTATQTNICNGASTTISLGSSESGVNYYLRDDLDSTEIDGPIAGIGSSISLNTGNVTATTTYNVYAVKAGAVSSAIDFKGAGRVTISGLNISPSIIPLFTAEAWINLSSNAGLQTVVGNDNGGYDRGIVIWNGTYHIFAGRDINTNIVPSTNVWEHVAVSWTSSSIVLYVNGVNVFSTTGETNNPGPADTYISGTYPVHGIIDEVRLWNTVRTVSQVSTNMSRSLTGSELGLIAYYQFEDGTGSSTVSDKTTNSHTGTVSAINTATDWVDGTTIGIVGGCSVEMSTTPTVTIINGDSTTDVQTACDTYSWIDGNTYLANNNTATHILTNAAGCDSVITLDLTLNITPYVDSLSNQTLCNGVVQTLPAFTGTGLSYNWTNDNPAIGLPASGNGNIQPFTPINTGNVNDTATITVTPLGAAYAYITDVNLSSVFVVNTATGVTEDTIPVGASPLDVIIHPNGSTVYVVNRSSNSISVISTASNTVTSTISLTNPLGATISPNGNTLYVAYNINKVAIINTSTNIKTGDILLPSSGYPQDMAVTPDGSKLYVANTNDFKVVVIETVGYTQIANIPVGISPKAVIVTNDGTKVYVSNAQGQSVSVISTATNAVIKTIGIGGLYPGSICLSPDGSRLYVSNSHDWVNVINTTTDVVIANIPAYYPQGISVSPDGSKLYVVFAYNGLVVFNTATNTPIDTIAVGPGPRSLGGQFIRMASCGVGPSESYSLIVSPNLASDTSAVVCDSFTWYGTTYTSSVIATHQLTSVNGCDSVVTIDLTINTIVDQTLTATDNSLCQGASTTINTATSESGVNYTLYEATGNTIVAGPTAGTGASISLSTGNLTTNTDFYVEATTSPGYALDFTGGTVNLGNSITIGTNDITWEAWIKADAFSTNQCIICKDPSTAANQARLNTNQNKFQWILGSVTLFSDSLNTAQWYHVAGVRSGNAHFLYVDGVLVDSDTAISVQNHTANGTNVTIGRRASGDLPWDGLMDEVRIWNVARTQAEIQSSMNATLIGTETGLVSYFDFNEGIGTAVSDKTGNHSSIITGSTSWVTGLASGPSCSVTSASNVSIAVSTVLVANSSVTSPLACNGNLNGQVTGSATGGTTPYTYSWSTGGTSALETGLGAGTYSVTITDANGCTSTSSSTVTEPTILVSASVVDSNSTCNGFADGGASASATGGTMPYTYSWSNTATTASITGVIAGTYSVTITDANGCTSTSSATVTEPTILVSASVVDSNITCNGLSNGGATASSTGGTMPYTYAWSNTATTASITGVIAGTYSVTITDANGCTSTSLATVTEPTILVSASVVDSNITCNGLSDGGATASSTGGTMPYTYSWSNTATTASITGVIAGTYSVTITDANGCTTTSSATVTEPTILVSASVVDSNITCNGLSDGGATASSTGGTMPYTYAWSNTATTASITGVIAGTYSVTITDANGCTTTSSATVTEPTILVSASVVDSNITCNGLSDGGATASSTGGTMPYTYAWNNSATTASITGVLAGTYSVTISDANGCTSTSSVTVVEPTILVSASTVDSNITCNGLSDGGATGAATGGTMPYTYAWSNSATTATITGVIAGTYSVTITDANGCTSTSSATVVEPAMLVSVSIVDSSITCNGLSDGGATGAATGGTAPYTYAWSSSATTASITGVIAGTYSVTVSDNNGCSSTSSVTVTEPAIFIGTTVVDSNVTCFDGNDGGMTASAIGGTMPFAYLWTTSTSSATFATTASITGLVADSFAVVITDANGCMDSSSATVIEPPMMTLNIGNDTIVCLNQTVVIDAGAGFTTYSWSDNTTMQTTTANTSVYGSTDYSVTVTNVNGCEVMDTLNVSVNNLSSVTITPISDLCAYAMDTLMATTGFESYLWSTSDTTNDLIVDANTLSQGSYTYSIIATDSNGCIAYDTTTVGVFNEVAIDLGPDVNVQWIDGVVESYLLDAGTGYASYSWNNGSGSSQTYMVTLLNMGNVYLDVTDATGCIGRDTVFVDFILSTPNIEIGQVKMYPNPAHDVLNIEISNFVGQNEMDIKIMSITGAVVLNQNYQVSGSTIKQTVDVSSYSPGTYFVEFNSNGQKTIKSFIVR